MNKSFHEFKDGKNVSTLAIIAVLILSLFTVLKMPNVKATVTLPFSDGFETGDWSAFDGNITSTDQTLEVSTEQEYAGTYSLKSVTSGSGYAANVYGNFTNSDGIYASENLFISSTTGTSYVMFLRLESIGLTDMAAVGITGSTGTISLRYRNASTTQTITSTSTLTTGTWVNIQLHVVRSDTVGTVQVFVDGENVTDLAVSGLSNNYALNRASFGQYANWRGATTSYVDDCQISTTFIEESAPPVGNVFQIVPRTANDGLSTFANVTVWATPYYGYYGSSFFDTALTELSTTSNGAITHVCLRIHSQMVNDVWEINETAIDSYHEQSQNWGNITAGAAKILAHGFELDVWFVGYNRTAVSNYTLMLENYKNFMGSTIAPYVESLGADLFCMGAESAEYNLPATTYGRGLGIIGDTYTTEMLAVQTAVRANYTGHLGWEFNFPYVLEKTAGTTTSYNLMVNTTWAQGFDYVVIAAWQRLVPDNTEYYTADECYEGIYSAPDTDPANWDYVQCYKNISMAWGVTKTDGFMPMVLNIGFGSCLEAAADPWSTPRQVVNLEAQSYAFEGSLRAYREWTNETWILGLHLEQWDSTSSGTPNHEFRNKPARFTIMEGLGYKDPLIRPTGTNLQNCTSETTGYDSTWVSDTGGVTIGYPYGTYHYVGFSQFAVNIPLGSTVNNANISVYVNSAEGAFNMSIGYLDVDNFSEVRTTNPMSASVSATTISVDTSSAINGTWFSFDASILLQDFIDNVNYTQGDSIVLKFMKGDASANERFTWYAQHLSLQGEYKTKLAVVYTENSYVTEISTVSPEVTAYNSSVPWQVTVGGNETEVALQINVYNYLTGVAIGENQTSATGTFTIPTTGLYTFAVSATGSHGSSDYETVFFAVYVAESTGEILSI
ncbi:MAG: hypothetical protein WC325_10920, partial [Candidatus Bathyarchaeia archaeon]